MIQYLPQPVLDVIQQTYTGEFSTIAKDGTPITWPITLYYNPTTQRIVTGTALAFIAKANNVRRNPHVSVLFSDFTGSGLQDPPAVLVQGTATSPDKIITDLSDEPDLVALGQRVGKIQKTNIPLPPFMMQWVIRNVMDWYYMRVKIEMTVERVQWWPQRDFSQQPQSLDLQEELAHVE